MTAKPKLIFIRIIIFLFISVNGYSQDTIKKETISSFHQGLTISYIYQEVQFFSIGGKLLFNYDKEGKQKLGTGICMDVALNARILTLAPRIYVEHREGFFGVRATLVNYIRQTDNELRISPELFLCYKDYISLGVAYGFSLSTKSFEDISPYRFTLTYAFLK